jgi:SAM-dependent methyltransferase
VRRKQVCCRHTPSLDMRRSRAHTSRDFEQARSINQMTIISTAAGLHPTRCPACDDSDIRRVRRSCGHAVLRCRACRLDFVLENVAAQRGSSKHESSTTPEELVASYRRTIDLDIAAARESLRLRIPLLETAFGGSLSSVCEVGCSTGTGFYGFHDRSIDWLGLETDPQWIELGRERKVPIIEADLANLDQRFDLIYFHQVLEHIWESRPFMKTVFDHLTPGGIVHVAVPNHAGFTALVRRALPRLVPDEFGMIQFPHHLRAYSPITLRTLFINSGLTPLEVRGISHTDRCWGEWFYYRGKPIHRLIFTVAGLLGLGSLLFGYAKKPAH